MTDFTTLIVVDASPQAVFDAINSPRDWWGIDIEGDMDRVGAEWTYRYKGIHRSTHRVSEWVPAKRVVWDVVDCDIAILKDRAEWKGTRMVFEIEPKGQGAQLRFTHVGLTPGVECYEMCTGAWGLLIAVSLKQLIEQGVGQPSLIERDEDGEVVCQTLRTTAAA